MSASASEERYLGGFYSPVRMAIGKLTTGHSIGAGVYATDKRFFLLGHGKAGFPSTLNRIVPGSDKGDFVPVTLTKEQNDAIIQAVVQNRVFEIGRGEVSQIVVTKPPGFLRTGWLKITSLSQRTLEVKVTGNNEYEWTARIAQAFKPEAVKLD